MDLNEMIKEYLKGRKFAEYVDKACETYGDTVEDECKKAIVQEYYKSIKDGVNKEK